MNKFDLSVPNRQSVRGLLLIFLLSLRKGIQMFWPILLVYVFQGDFLKNTLLIVFGILGILVLLGVHTVLYYLNFYFYVEKGEFILKKGYLQKKVLAVPLERIQSVNTKQNLIQQALNVVSLEIDTAGTVGKELKIQALEMDFAQELQKHLQTEKRKIKADETTQEEAVEENKEELVLQLSPTDLLKIGISQNHLRTALIVIAFGSQLFQQADDLFKEKTEEFSNEFTSFLSSSGTALIAFLIIFFLMISILISLFRTVLKYFDFKLLKSENYYRIESGLVNKRNVIVPHNKVQELNWETGPLKKLFGIYHLTFRQAVSGQQNRKNQQLVDAPGCLAPQLDQLKSDLFGADELSSSEKIFTDNYYFRRLWLFIGWLPVALAIPFLYAEFLFWLGAAVWLAGAAGYSFLMLKKRYFRINGNQIRISKGAIEHKWKQMELFKIQAVEYRQTIFQKRRKLASLQLMNAAGSMTIPFIDEKLAMQIYNYLLYHTEISEKKWM